MAAIDRLRKRADFLRVQKEGRKWVTPTCVVQIASLVPPALPLVVPAQAGTHLQAVQHDPSWKMDPRIRGDDTVLVPGISIRYGLTIPKKIWPRAVDRNRVRRRVRAVLLAVLADPASGPKSVDIVVFPRADALKAPAAAIEKDLRWALRRLLQKDGGL